MVNPLVERLHADLLQLAAPSVACPGLRVVAAGVEGATALLSMNEVQFRKRCLRPVPADAGELP